MNKIVVSMLAGGALLGQTAICSAVQFANFTEASGNGFVYNGKPPVGPGSGASTLTGTGIPVNFYYQSILGGDLTGHATTGIDYVGDLTISGSATTGEVPKNSHQNAFDSLTITITATNTAANVAAGLYNTVTHTGLVLLQVTAGTATSSSNPNGFAGSLMAVDGQGSAGLTGSNPVGSDDSFADFVAFSSQAIDTSKLLSQAYGLSFSNINTNTGGVKYTSYNQNYPGPPPIPPLELRYLNNFTASGGGTFSADTAVPEPGTMGLLFGALVSCSAIGLRRRRK
jgi:hypothetical protein